MTNKASALVSGALLIALVIAAALIMKNESIVSVSNASNDICCGVPCTDQLLSLTEDGTAATLKCDGLAQLLLLKKGSLMIELKRDCPLLCEDSQDAADGFDCYRRIALQLKADGKSDDGTQDEIEDESSKGKGQLLKCDEMVAQLKTDRRGQFGPNHSTIPPLPKCPISIMK